MGIYNGKKSSSVSAPAIGSKSLFLVGAIIVVAVALFFAIAVVPDFLKPKSIVSFFTLNPLDASKEQNTVLKVRVFNPLDETVQNASLSVLPVAADDLIVYPQSQIITTFGSREFREFSFSVRPNPGKKVSPGTYRIRLVLEIRGQKFEDETVLVIKTS